MTNWLINTNEMNSFINYLLSTPSEYWVEASIRCGTSTLSWVFSAYKHMNYSNMATLNLCVIPREKQQRSIKNTYLHNTMAYNDSPTWIIQASQ